MPLTTEIMQRLWPHGDQHIPGLTEAIVTGSGQMFGKYGIDTDLLVAHFMAQTSEECGAGGEMVENMNFSAEGLVRTWPTRFGADRAAKFAHNPEMIAETVYGGRKELGNDPPPSHDGWLYRGHGLTQLTGKMNYRHVGDLLGLNLVEDPDLVNDPDHALEIALVDFVKVCNCLPPAKNNDVVGVTRALNGGLIGLADRRAWLRKWKAALGVK